MTSKIKAILALAPNADVTEYNNVITWNDGNPNNITEQQIIAKQQELIAEYNAKQYQRDRAKEYPDFKNYLDGIVKGDNAQVQKYINDCLAVKAKYPKE
jgi:hypothetical protein